MRAKKTWGVVLLAVGIFLLVTALLVTVVNFLEMRRTEEATAQLMAAAPTPVPTPTPGAEPTAQPDPTPAAEPEPSVIPTDPPDPPTLSSEILDGHEYVGYLEFPSLDSKLPVIKIKYVNDLQIAPCLEKGSPHTNDAVISAHNYPSHFGPIRDWTGGEAVIFTDLNGNVINYTVKLVETIAPTDVDKVMNSEYDLVLYTCTTGGEYRVMIACDRTK